MATGQGKTRTRGQKIRRGIAWGALGVVVVGGGLGVWAYSHLDGNIRTVDIKKALGNDRPAQLPTGAQDILLLGSDSRSGLNGDVINDHEYIGARSDTAMLVHIPAGRKRATVVSIPRDTLVDRPSCTSETGRHVAAAHLVMFNSVFSTGGPPCVVKTIEKMTDIRIDHYVEIDFSGFKSLVDAMGGVDITVDKAIDDKHSGLDIPAGTSKLNGTQSLAFVRTRYSVGDGSDLGRIQLQQKFLISVLSQIQKQKSLSDPVKLYRIGDAATKAITTDSDLGSLTSLLDFAKSMQGLNSAHLQTVQLPVAYDVKNPNRVVPVRKLDDELWQALRTDAPIPEAVKHSPAHGTV
ncbi:LCP family protein [Streptacidiphilus monticola]|uniref:LCP family protein n=1 Tax=Streptacidiphilus monticola TaxID=2161674 RepID=A0ABW1G3J5_9ACTN